jgi:hypothetical protein
MNDLGYILLTNALAATCVAFAVIFVTLPMPKNEGLRNYRISLRFLFVAYTMSALIAVCDKILVNVLSMIFLSMCSFLILLFSLALINLLHPERISRKFVVLHAIPLLLVNVVYWLLAMRLGNPILASMNLFLGNMFHPQVIIRMMTWMACVIQLVYFASIFRKEVASYKTRLNEYFSEKLNLT